VNRAVFTKLVEGGLPASPSLGCLELPPPPWCCRNWVFVYSGICRGVADHAARIAEDYPIKRLAIAIQELACGRKFVEVVLAAVCTVSEIAQRAFGAFLIKLPSFADVACAQQVNYLFNSRKGNLVLSRPRQGGAACH
jgi:hypothetical protein